MDELNLELASRLDFMELDAEARAMLRELRPLIERAIGPSLARFYAKVKSNPETARFFRDDSHIAHAKGKQQQHWNAISSGDFNADYARRVTAIGNVHARLGLEPRWYVAGYALVAEDLIGALLSERPTGLFRGRQSNAQTARMAGVLVKAILLDVELSISTYLAAIDERRKVAEAARAKAEAEQQEAMTAIAEGLKKLAAGDMTVRIDTALAPQFETVRDDFNTTLARLQQAMETVRDSATTITQGTREITAAADDFSRRTEQQAASLEQTAAALDEITATVKRAADGSRQAQEVVTDAKRNAEDAGVVVRMAVEAMGSIEHSSSQISRIIGVIDEIAFQTNLLALNAGVEAARAGDAGRGFAVVASEVRALAQRSAEAAREIKELISTSAAHVAQGVDYVGRTGKSLEKIMAQVLDINDVVTNIASGAKEQATGLHEVNTAVNLMDQATQQNAAMVEESTAASHSLMQQAAELQQLISTFKLAQAAAAMRASEMVARRPAPSAAQPKRLAGKRG